MYVRGFGSSYIFTAILYAAKMFTVYLLKFAKNLFGKTTTIWTLQEDNDPKHRSRLRTMRKAKRVHMHETKAYRGNGTN